MIRSLGTTADALFGFEIEQGRMIVTNGTNDADNPGVVIAVKVHNESWRLELTEAGTQCGIEITRREPDQLEQDFGENAYTGKLFVVKGSVRFSDQSGTVQVIADGDWLFLTPEDRAQMTKDNNALTRPPLLNMVYPFSFSGSRPRSAGRAAP